MSEITPTDNTHYPDHLFHAFSVRRSGHHIVIHWLSESHKQRGIPSVEVNDVFNAHINHFPNLVPRVFDAAEIMRRAKEKQVKSNQSPPKAVFVNYEDFYYSRRRTTPAYTDPAWEQQGVHQRDIVVVRDWYNVVASRLQKVVSAEEGGGVSLSAAISWEHTASLWREHASLLDADIQSGPTAINYNAWFLSKKYRDQISEQFGVASDESSLSHVPSFARGSSFDEQALDGKGRFMNVLRRWEDLRPDLRPRYEQIIGMTAAQGVDELNRLHFGFGRQEVLGDR